MRIVIDLFSTNYFENKRNTLRHVSALGSRQSQKNASPIRNTRRVFTLGISGLPQESLQRRCNDALLCDRGEMSLSVLT